MARQEETFDRSAGYKKTDAVDQVSETIKSTNFQRASENSEDIVLAQPTFLARDFGSSVEQIDLDL